MKQKPVDQRVEDALNSLDGVKRATVQPWFFTRVNARLQKEDNSRWSAIGSFLSKPAIALAGVTTIILLNVFLLLSDKDMNSAVALSGQTEQQLTSTIDSEAIIASNSSYEYENLVQP